MTTASVETPATGAAPDAGRLPVPLKIAYGIGSMSYGLKDNGFNYFLLLFYAQVVGLEASLAGLAVLIALLIDAITDPIVGYWSDNLHSRWGRRHPFMYAAILPVTVSYFLLWTPPDLDQWGLFFYLLTLAIIIRTFITLFETPSSALGPELTQDYVERSSMLSYRYFFGWSGGNTLSVIMFFFLFPYMATETQPDGRFNPDSYRVMAWIAAIGMFASMVISTAGTHHRIPQLQSPPPKRQLSLKRVFGEIFETLANRSFVFLFIASMLGAVATGLAAGLAFYFYTYFWEFSSIQTGIIMLATFLAAVLGFVLAPIVTRHLGKKRGAIIIGLIAFIGAPTPLFLRLVGILPAETDNFVFWFVFITNAIDVGLIICYQILTASMIADLVEQSELKTGRRSEGTFMAAVTFIKKSVQGLGLMMATFVLWLAEFPTGADVSEVSRETSYALAGYYIPIILSIWLSMVAVISGYRIDEETHTENLKALAERRSSSA